MSEKWVEAAAVDDVPEGDVIGVAPDGRDIALYSVDGSIYATDNVCTHAQANLCEGFLEGHEIECPLHQGKFDIRTGKALCPPLTDDIRTYPVRIDGGKVYIAIEAAAPPE
jgi:naphthalene 1,2-dioxygenase system ferredoxin subunit